MEVRDYLRVLRRRWISIALIAVLLTAAAGAYTSLQTPQYSSTARLFVTTSQTDDAQLFQGGQFSAQRVKSYADLITSRELALRVIAETGVDTSPSALSSSVSAEAVLETVNLEITTVQADPHEAQRIAQAYAEQLTDLVRELETPTGQSEAPVKATIVDAASFSDDQVSPKPVRNVALGLLLGLLLGFGIAVLREVLDTRIKSMDDLLQTTDAPALGTIAYDSASNKTPLLTQIDSHAPRAESFRVLRTNLQFIEVDSARKVFVVSSAVPGEGKTSTSVNLALSLAQAGGKVLLVSGDLRRPAAAERLGLDNAVGVTSVLVGKLSASEAIQQHEPSGLDFIASGPVPPNPAELLQSKAMSDFLDYAASVYDTVLIDAPPLLPVTDAALLAAQADGAILVVSHGFVTKEQVRLSIQRLEQVDARLVGVVLNKVPAKASAYGYGYGYGYGYAPLDAPKAEQAD